MKPESRGGSYIRQLDGILARELCLQSVAKSSAVLLLDVALNIARDLEGRRSQNAWFHGREVYGLFHGFPVLCARSGPSRNGIPGHLIVGAGHADTTLILGSLALGILILVMVRTSLALG